MYKQIRFTSFSFGCRVNEAERIEMNREMIAAGFILDHKIFLLLIVVLLQTKRKGRSDSLS